MNKTMLLTKNLMLGFFSFNKMRFATGKQRRKYLMMGLLYLLVGAMAVGYSLLIANAFVGMGFAVYVPSFALLICSLITLIFTFLKANGTLFGLRDYDMVMSLPVSSAQVIASRLLSVYLSDLLSSALILIPCLVLFFRETGGGLLLWIYALIVLLLAPMIPMMLGIFLGALVTALTARLRHTNLVTTIVSFVFVFGAMIASISFQSMDLAALTSLAAAFGAMISRIYPPAALVTRALAQGSVSSLLLYIFASLAIAAAAIWILSRFYNRINSALFVRATRRNFTLGKLSSSSPFVALYRREMRRLGTCPTYILNSCIGSVMLLFFSAFLVLSPASGLGMILSNPKIQMLFRPFVPFVCSIMVCITTTTCSSISLEGNFRWIIAAIPVKPKAVYDAKILVNLTIMLPSVLISSAIFAATFTGTLIDALLFFLIPIAYTFMISVAGLVINLTFPKYDWSSPQEAVKQSMAVMVTMGVGFGSNLLPMTLLFFFPQASLLISAASVLAATAATILLYLPLKNRLLSDQ